MFPQVHRPGEAAQSDFTHMADLQVTLGGVPFPHLVFHLVLTYSNVEAVYVCPSESFEALAEGIETCLWQFGGVPRTHRTDHLSAAIRPLAAAGRAQATARYEALMAHYGLEPTTNNDGNRRTGSSRASPHQTWAKHGWVRRRVSLLPVFMV
jgi:transposase